MQRKMGSFVVGAVRRTKDTTVVLNRTGLLPKRQEDALLSAVCGIP